MDCLPKSQAGRRYTRRVATAMSFYVGLLFASLSAIKHLHPAHLLIIALSILPAIPIIAVIVIVGLYLKEERDEFQRTLLIQSMLWGMGITLAVTSVWGFLEMFAGTAHFPAFYVFVLFWFVVGIVGIVQRLQYRSADE